MGMMTDDLISVIVPVYNAERYLERCVNSILSQTYRHLEILLVNDGSTDGSPQICERLAETDGRIRVFHQENKGEGGARNAGLSAATGAWIAFVDSDDTVHPQMMERMIQSAQAHNSDVTVCSFVYVDEEGGKLPWKTPSFAGSKAASSREAQKAFLTTHNIEGFAWNKLVRRTLYQKENIAYGTDRTGYIDINTSFRLLCMANRVAFVDEALYDYYQLAGSLEHRFQREKWDSYFSVIREVHHEAYANGLGDEADYYYYGRCAMRLYDGLRWKKRIPQEEWRRFREDYSWEKVFPFSILRLWKLFFRFSDASVWKSALKSAIVRCAYA